MKGTSALKLGLHFSFQTAHGDSRETIQQGLREIEVADQDGFSCAVFAEHHFASDGWIPRPMMLAAAAATRTKNIKVGSNIVILPLHHPVAVAEEAAILDILSGGRAVVGVAPGWVREEFAGFGVPFSDRVEIFATSLGALVSLLRGESVTLTEGPYCCENAQIRPRPLGKVPVRAGAVSDNAVRRVATLVDAWMMPPMPRIKVLKRQKEMFDETRAEAGLPPVLEQPIRREVFVADTVEQGWQAFAPGIRHEYGKVYRSFDPTYPDNDSVSALRKWGEDLFPVGPPKVVAEQILANGRELRATEVLVRYQLPGVTKGSVAQCFEGLREVRKILSSTGATSVVASSDAIHSHGREVQ
jgi:alkanesulfonate monooxygenase SsuD/methylene tetrahydromethanopterin reductase-like flavin-dependent oxidoreductase (luciferase family)